MGSLGTATPTILATMSTLSLQALWTLAAVSLPHRSLLETTTHAHCWQVVMLCAGEMATMANLAMAAPTTLVTMSSHAVQAL